LNGLKGDKMSINVNKRKFLRYEVVRKSGKYNMFLEVKDAMKEAQLTFNEYVAIQRDYGKFREAWLKNEKSNP
tara:strand:- start:219 stop:437 length:219 start_codon:yes stop_codon:yes gene_type:complete